MKCSVKLSDGTKLRTSSRRRYVIFAIADDSHVKPIGRTDDFQTAMRRHNAYVESESYCRVVTVDTYDAALHGMFGGPIFDSANLY